MCLVELYWHCAISSTFSPAICQSATRSQRNRHKGRGLALQRFARPFAVILMAISIVDAVPGAVRGI
jgi:hypothetical protein